MGLLEKWCFGYLVLLLLVCAFTFSHIRGRSGEKGRFGPGRSRHTLIANERRRQLLEKRLEL